MKEALVVEQQDQTDKSMRGSLLTTSVRLQQNEFLKTTGVKVCNLRRQFEVLC